MDRVGIVDRVKAWFATAKRPRRAAGEVRGWSAGPLDVELVLAGASAGKGDLAAAGPPVPTKPARAAGMGESPDLLASAVAEATPQTCTATLRQTAASAPETPVAAPHRPPAEWLDRLEALPERIGQAVAASAAGAKAMEKIAAELAGHRAAGRTVAEAVARLPALASGQAGLVKHTNELLEEQNRLTAALIDGLAGLRAAFRTIEESSKRHLACLAHLETVHRQVLEVYQTTLLKAHRRLGRLAVTAVLLAAAALAGVAWAAYLSVAP